MEETVTGWSGLLASGDSQHNERSLMLEELLEVRTAVIRGESTGAVGAAVADRRIRCWSWSLENKGRQA